MYTRLTSGRVKATSALSVYGLRLWKNSISRGFVKRGNALIKEIIIPVFGECCGKFEDNGNEKINEDSFYDRAV